MILNISNTRRYLSNKIGLVSFGFFMKKICKFEVCFLPSRHPARPMPAGRPVRSGGRPASSPAHAGWKAGSLGSLPGILPGPCRLPGRLAQLGRCLLSPALRAQPGMLPGPCRVAGRLARVAGRHAGQLRPAAMPAVLPCSFFPSNGSFFL